MPKHLNQVSLVFSIYFVVNLLDLKYSLHKLIIMKQ